MQRSPINRRSFLGTIGATAGGLALAASVSSQTQAQEPGAAQASSAVLSDIIRRRLPRTGEELTALGDRKSVV